MHQVLYSTVSALPPAVRASAPLRAMIYRILKRVPGGEQTKVFVGVCLVLGIGASPAPESAGAPPARARDERMAARARARG